MAQTLSDQQWDTVADEIRALIAGWRQALGGPPRDDIAQVLIEVYDGLSRREAQIAKLTPTVDYTAPLRGTLAGLIADRNEMRGRVANLYARWREANPA